MNNDLEVAVLRLPFLVELEFRNEYIEKNLSGQRKEQRQTQTTFGVDGGICEQSKTFCNIKLKKQVLVWLRLCLAASDKLIITNYWVLVTKLIRA